MHDPNPANRIDPRQQATDTPRVARCAVYMLVALLGACTVGPDYQPPVTQSPDTWSAPLPDTQAAAETDAATLASWWQHFDDPLLERLVEHALTASPDLRSARARVREARAARAQTRAAWFPTLQAGFSRTQNHASDATGRAQESRSYRSGLDVGWEIDLFGGTRRASEAAEADLQAARADLQAVRVSLAAEVALEYVNLRRLQEQLTIARHNLDTQAETAQIAQWRAMAGLASTLDAEQAISAREQTRARVPAIETSLAQSRHRLATLLADPGETILAELVTPGPVPLPRWQLAVGIPADTLRRRPDVRSAERRLAAANARIGVATAARFPSLSLSGTLGLQASSLAGLDAHDADVWSLGSSLAATLFDGGRLRRETDIRTALQEQALASWENTVLGALEETGNALAALDGSEREREALNTAASAARNAALLARSQYEVGLIDFATLLLAERTRLDAENSLAAARADSAATMIQLYKALGGGWDPSTDTTDSG